jgi:antitoxin PrlF
MKSPRLITLRSNGQLTLPAGVRATAHAAAGDVFVAEVQDDTIVLRPKKLVDASQAYFWTDEWQAAEREASEDISKGRVKGFRSAESMIRDLHKTRDKRR